MLGLTKAALAWLLIIGVPGWLLCDALRREAGRARNVALAPACGFGVLYVVAHAVEAVGLPVNAATALPLCLVGSVVSWVAIRRPARWAPRASRLVLPNRLDSITLAVAAALGSAVWIYAIRDPALLPNTDGLHHALFTARIQTLQSVDPAKIASPDGIERGSYYPLALHIAAALVASVAGVGPGTAITVAVVMAAAVALPVGTLVLTRRLNPTTRLVAPIAAVLAVLFLWFPYSPMVWGGVPTVVGMCLIPAVVDALWPHRQVGRAVAGAICVGIAALGLFQVHNPQLIAAAGIAFVLVAVNGGLRRGARNAALALWGVSALIVVAVSLPAVLATTGIASSLTSVATQGGSQRLPGTPSTFFAESGIALVEMIVSPPILLLSVVGWAICLLDKRCRGMGIVFLMWTMLFVGVAAKVPLLMGLAAPWYQAPTRISYYLSLPLVLWAAVAIEKGGAGIGWALSRALSSRVSVSTGAVAGAFLVVLGIASVQIPAVVSTTADIYRRSAFLGVDELDGFRWLHAHISDGGRVLNTFDDGSGWMGVLGYAQPLFATKPEEGGVAVWGDRWHLLTHAGALAEDATDQRAARSWHVEYAFTDTRHFPGTPPPAFTAAALEGSSAYRLVWRRGPVCIFRVVMPQG